MVKRVLITGGNGFTGSHIVREFLSNSVDVTCLVRAGSSIKNLDELQVKIIEGDITREESLVSAFTDYDFVIHNAALVNDWDSFESFYQANVVGTRNVLEACRQNGIENLIVTGSISSYGEEHNRATKDESFDFNSHYNYFLGSIIPCRMNYYRDTKALATREAIEIAKKNKMNLTILEPTFVYGEREFATGFYEYLKSAKGAMPLAPGSKKNKFPIVYAGDLSRAYFLAFKKKLTGVNRFIIGDHTTAKMDDILSLFCQKAGVKKPIPLPKWAVYLPGLFMELAWLLFRRKTPPLLTRGRVNMFVDNVEFSSAKAERLLGYKSSISLSEGIGRTVEWYNANGHL